MKGYTLIELLIVIGIIAILATVGVSAFARTREKQSIQTAREAILSVLQTAQKAAYIGDKDCIGSLVGIEVTFNGNDIRHIARCSNAGILNAGILQSKTIGDATFVNPTPTVTFRPLEQGVALSTGGVANIDYLVSSTTYRITVTPPGIMTYAGQVAP